jgi:hypothetical protein
VATPEDRDRGWDWIHPAELAWHLTEEQRRFVQALEQERAVVRLSPVPPMGVRRIMVACWDEAGWANARPPDRQWQVEADGSWTALAA